MHSQFTVEQQQQFEHHLQHFNPSHLLEKCHCKLQHHRYHHRAHYHHRVYHHQLRATQLHPLTASQLQQRHLQQQPNHCQQQGKSFYQFAATGHRQQFSPATNSLPAAPRHHFHQTPNRNQFTSIHSSSNINTAATNLQSQSQHHSVAHHLHHHHYHHHHHPGFVTAAVNYSSTCTASGPYIASAPSSPSSSSNSSSSNSLQHSAANAVSLSPVTSASSSFPSSTQYSSTGMYRRQSNFSYCGGM